jgi:hypothetical protein
MKKVLIIVGILLVLFIGYIWFFYFRGNRPHDKGPKPPPIAVSKHSETFNASVDRVLASYYSMTEGFVNWDTAVINKNGVDLNNALDSLRMDEMKKDTAKDADVIYLTAVDFISNAKNETGNILQQSAIDKKREALKNLTDNLFTFLRTVRYDHRKIFYQECPMAFNDDIPGYWLSDTKDVRNPYLGTLHPKYKSSMLECGSPKDSINFVSQETKDK